MGFAKRRLWSLLRHFQNRYTETDGGMSVRTIESKEKQDVEANVLENTE
jgi:hypothetical protein